MPAPTVFISYSHRDEAWKNKLLPQLKSLEQAGVSMRVWQDRQIDGGDQWYPEIQEAMTSAAAAILLISPDFLASKFCVQEEVPALLKRQEEKGMLLIPVLVRACVWQAHRWLKDRQMIPRDGKCVAIDFPGDLADGVFAAVASQVFDHFEKLAPEPVVGVAAPQAIKAFTAVRTVAADLDIIPPAPVVAWPAIPAHQIDLTRLPETGSALFGRDEELALLDGAWESSEEAGATPVRILAFTAHGGVGKSTLVNHWLAEMARDHYRNATRVFGWSFYSQGVREETVASADAFIDAALRFFGDSDPTAGSPWEKGQRLAVLVGSERTLLALDGLEPLQSSQFFDRGKLRDPALESFLRGLARQSAGLCIITTREPLPDLARRPGVTIRDLEQISPQAGRALLRTLRVVGTDAELEDLAKRFGPHALAVSLLGVYLREQPGHGIGPAQALEQMPGSKPIDRVLAGFEQWFGESPEREALRLLGFFDRPADAGCLRALRTAPAISGLTDRLIALSEVDWDHVLNRLEKLRLVHTQLGRSGQRSVDAHPLIREHFADLLKGSEAWRAGHRRLYEHLCATTKEGDQPTLQDLQPLYQAVAHGCQAGMQQEAFGKVYYTRILRGQEAYSANKLGAFGSDLGAVASFFESPWALASPSLTEGDQAFLLNEAATRLQALGRLTDALDPLCAALDLSLRQKKWKLAANVGTNLSCLNIMRADLQSAVRAAEQSVIFAGQDGDAFTLTTTHGFLGNALHLAGRRPEAEARLREAEALQAGRQPEHPLLFSLGGFIYCELLLAAPERAAWQVFCSADRRPLNAIVYEQTLQSIQHRVSQTLDWAENRFNLGLLSIALDHLTKGRVALYKTLLEGASLDTCHTSLRHAMERLRRFCAQEFIMHGLLTRAWLRSLTGVQIGSESAQSDLDEAWEIAERGPMPLFMADIHLYRARLFFSGAKYPWTSPQVDLAEGRRLIEKHGYWRRKEELEDAEAALLRR